jgi:hypothetical protein
MERQIQEIQHLATKYSKADLGRMVQMGLIDPQRAMMAGMMIDRIQKQNTQAPQSTVAQDVLGLGSVAPQQPQQMQQPQVPPQGTGIEQLPAGDVGEYAGGGIVAFGDGGDVPGYAGDEKSLVEYKPGLFERGFMFPEGSFLGSFQRNTLPFQESPAMRNTKELQNIEQRLMDPNLPNAERQRLEQGRAVLTQRLSTSYPSEGARGSATFANVAPATSAPSADALPPLDVPSRRAPASGGGKAAGVTPPVIGPFDPNAVKIQGEEIPLPEMRDRKGISAVRRAAEIEEGVDPEMYSKMIKGIEDKKGKLEKRKGEARGEALMQLGLGLMGAREGQEFQTLSESGIKALGAYKQDVKDLRAAEEKYDERMETLRISDQQAKQTGARSDVAQAEKDRDAFNAARVERAKAKNDLIKTTAQVSAQVYGNQMQADVQRFGYEKSAETQRYVAGLQAQTSREYTASLRQQGLQDSQIKNIMGTAAEIYKAALSKNPMADETQTWAAALQQASSGYASVAPMVGRTMPGPVPAAPKLSKEEIKKMYNLP